MIFLRKKLSTVPYLVRVHEKLKISIEFLNMDIHVDHSQSYFGRAIKPLEHPIFLELLYVNSDYYAKIIFMLVNSDLLIKINILPSVSLLLNSVASIDCPFSQGYYFFVKSLFSTLPFFFFSWLLGLTPSFSSSSNLFSSFALYLQRYIEHHKNFLEQYCHYRNHTI